MENILKKVLYILVAFFLLILSNYLVIKPLLKGKDDDIIELNTNDKITALEKRCDKQEKLYLKYSLITDNIEKKSQEWFQVNLRSDAVVKFQYYNTSKETAKLNLTINDTPIENVEEFFLYDRFKLNFHFYGDILVIEHTRSYNHLPFLKIINLADGSKRNLPATPDFLISEIIVDEYGITASYNRLTSQMEYYLEKQQINIPFRVNNTNVSLNICKKETWPQALKDLDYVYFDINYVYQDDKIDFENPSIVNLRKLEQFLAPYLKEFEPICKNK